MEAKKEFTGHKHKREESKSFTVSKVTKCYYNSYE